MITLTIQVHEKSEGHICVSMEGHGLAGSLETLYANAMKDAMVIAIKSLSETCNGVVLQDGKFSGKEFPRG